MSTTVILSLPPIQGRARSGTEHATGHLAPAVFSRAPSSGDRRGFFLGIIHDTTIVEMLPVATAIDERVVRTLGYRWLWFVTSLFERDIALDEQLAREAWFAANREPPSFNEAATLRGIGVMQHHLGAERANAIRDMAPPA